MKMEKFVKLMTGHFDNREQFTEMKSAGKLFLKKFIENSVDSVKFLAYNDIEAESLLRNLRSVMHNTKGGMPT